jgi:hypothetical protein
MEKMPSAEELHPYRGMWIGFTDGHVIISSIDITEFVRKMRMLRIELDGIYRVPQTDD